MPAAMRQALFEIALASMVLGNSDNYAKNHALLYTTAKPDLASAYDVDPVLLDTGVTHAMSFCIGRARMVDDVGRDHLDAFMTALGVCGYVNARQMRVFGIAQRSGRSHVSVLTLVFVITIVIT